MVYNSSLDNNIVFGPCVLRKAEDNATYSLSELDGTLIITTTTGKSVKKFMKRGDIDTTFGVPNVEVLIDNDMEE